MSTPADIQAVCDSLKLQVARWPDQPQCYATACIEATDGRMKQTGMVLYLPEHMTLEQWMEQRKARLQELDRRRAELQAARRESAERGSAP